MSKAMDLSREVPRSPFDTLDGITWLPRLIDKARATFAGTHGEYTPYPCPADQRFLEFYGLKADALGEVIRSGASDADILAWVKQNQKPRTEQENAEFRKSHATPPADPEVAGYLAQAAKEFDPKRTDITSWAKLICAEEGHPWPSDL